MRISLASCLILTASASMSLPAQAQQFFHPCYPMDVFAAGNRVHVRCQHPEIKFSSPPNNLVVFFAVPTSNKELSDRLLALGTAAIVNKKWLGITYDSSLGNSYGCQDRNCRPLLAVSLQAEPLRAPPPPVNPPVE